MELFHTTPFAASSSRTLFSIDSLPIYKTNQHHMTYAGIGSRETPPDILDLMRCVAARLEARGYLLHTGDAKGADSAFASGCQRRQVFKAADANLDAMDLARAIHPNPRALSPFALRLMARNAFQVFSADLNQAVDWVLCWTSDGCESKETRSRSTGGTGQAIELASRRGVPVINMRNPDWAERITKIIKPIETL